MIQKLYHWLKKLEELSLIICISAIVFLMFLQVITRYVIVLPAPWASELGTFSLVWLVFIGAAVASRNNRHIRVDSIFSRFPKKIQFVIHICILSCIIVVLAILVYFGIVRAQMSSSSILPATRIPMTYIMISVPTACVLMIIHYVVELIGQFHSTERGDTA